MNLKSFLSGAILLIIFATSPYSSHAQSRIYSNEFMNIGAGAKAMSMANAQTSLVNDVSAGFWNPAGLVKMENNLQASLMHAEYFSGIANYDYGAIGLKVNDKSALGFSFLRFGVDDIPNTLSLVNPDGTIDYNQISSFSAVDYGFILSYSRKASDYLRFGGNAKVIHRTVGPFAKAWGFGFDLGSQYDYGPFNMGLMLKDITTTFNAWSFTFTPEEKKTLRKTGNIVPDQSVEITLPRAILGAGTDFDIGEKINFRAALDFEFTFDGRRNTLIKGDPVSVDPRIGLELGLWDVVFVRMGAGQFQEEKLITAFDEQTVTTFQPNAGLGLKYRKIKLDYAFTDITGSNTLALHSHVISLSFGFDPE